MAIIMLCYVWSNLLLNIDINQPGIPNNLQDLSVQTVLIKIHKHQVVIIPHSNDVNFGLENTGN